MLTDGLHNHRGEWKQASGETYKHCAIGVSEAPTVIGSPARRMGRHDRPRWYAHGSEHLSEAAYWDEIEFCLSIWALRLGTSSSSRTTLGKPDAHSTKVVSVVDGLRDRSETRPGGKSDPYAKTLRLTDANGLRIAGCKNYRFASRLLGRSPGAAMSKIWQMGRRSAWSNAVGQ